MADNDRTPEDGEDVDAADLARVRAYLDANRRRVVPEAADSAAWEEFHRHLDPTVRAAVSRWLPSSARDDGAQEAWRAIVGALPDFRPDAKRGRVRDWVAGVAWRAAANLARALVAQAARPLDGSQADAPRGQVADPAEGLLRDELAEEVRAALETMRLHVSPLAFEVFRRTSVDETPLTVVAAALGLTREQARRHNRNAEREFRRWAAYIVELD